MGVAPETVADLWRHARELAEVAAREGDPAPARRALVTLAVAGSGRDPAGFEAVAREVLRALARVGSDPQPLFGAASALVAPDDEPARATLIRLPREAADEVKSELLGRLHLTD